MSITERDGISSVCGTDTVISSGVNSVESGTPLCAVNHGCSPRAKVPALQSMTAPCFTKKSTTGVIMVVREVEVTTGALGRVMVV